MKKLLASSILAFAAFLIPSLAFADNIVSSNITTNTTWSATTSSSTYVVTSNIAVNAGITLTINPGVVVKFQNVTLTVNGILNAQGVSTSSIYFTSYQDDSVNGDTNHDGTATAGAAGQWQSIVVSAGATTTIVNASIRYGGGGAIAMLKNSGGTFTITNTKVATSSTNYPALDHLSGTTTVSGSTFSNNKYGIYIENALPSVMTISSSTLASSTDYGLYVLGTPTLSVTNNSFATNTLGAVYINYGGGIGGGPASFYHTQNRAWGNGVNGFKMINVTIIGTSTWMGDTMPYAVSGGLSVNSGKTLTIATSSVIKFFDTTPSMNISGTLSVVGSAAAPVYFTSAKDDFLNDTNNNGTATSPAAGDWGSFYIPSGGTVTMDYANLRYGGNVNSAIIYTTGGTLNFSNSEVASSSTSGIQTFSGISNISTSTIYANTSYGITHSGGTTTIATSTIRNHSTYGFYTPNGTGNIIVNNSNFSANTKGAGLVNLADNLNFIHSNNVGTGTGKGGVLIYGTPGKAQTWYVDQQLPYIISTTTGNVAISTYTITVQPGAIIKFAGATAGLSINSGSFIADSSASTSKIYFTSVKDDTVGGDTNGDGTATTSSAGDWDGLSTVNNSGQVLTLNNTVVRYGGNNVTGSSKMIWNGGGTINIVNSEIASSSVHGIYTAAGTTNATSTTIHHNIYGYTHAGGTSNIANRGNTIYANSNSGILNTAGILINAEQIYWPNSNGSVISGPYSTTTNAGGSGDAVLPTYIDFVPWATTVSESGTISTNTTWASTKVHVVDGTLTVNSGVTLTVDPGAIVKFRTATSGMVVYGTLISDGSRAKSYFTSYKDDSIGGDTNTDAGSTTPTSGDWGSIKIESTGSSTLKSTDFRYGGYTGGISATIYNNGGFIDITNVEVATGTTYGIRNVLGTTTIIWSSIHDHTNGVCATGGSMSIRSSQLYRNSGYGVCNTTGVDIHGEYNYWGAANGPSGSGPGTGDAVSINVLFTNWTAVPHFLNLDASGLIKSSVSSAAIKWNFSGTTTSYTTPWYAAIKTWNDEGPISIATSTIVTDVLVSDIASSSSDFFSAQYRFKDSVIVPDTIEFNPYFMNQYSSGMKQHTTAHELGHALGLGHSYLNNLMNSYDTTQTALGDQDKSDYHYWWGF